MNLRQSIESKLDDLISEIVRLRDIKCITCEHPLNFKTAEAGHYMKRSNRGTRWNVWNVNAQCHECNVKDDTSLYREKMILKYGEYITEHIERVARTENHYSIEDLKIMYRELRDILNTQILDT
jgi:hypothetical protein